MAKENGLQVFENEKFGNVRVVIRDGEPWFVAADVCKVFGIVNNRNVTSRLDEDEKGVHDVDTVGGRQNVVIVNESGLYHMLFTMEPSNARGVKREDIELRIQQLKQFKRWITHDVIPALRKTGTYTITTKQDSYMIEDPIARAERWIEERKERDFLQAQIEEQRPAVEFTESICKSSDNIKMRDMAKLLCDENINIGEKRLYNLLRDKKVLMQDKSPYQSFVDRGYFYVSESSYTTVYGTTGISSTTLVTPKGQIWLVGKVREWTKTA